MVGYSQRYTYLELRDQYIRSLLKDVAVLNAVQEPVIKSYIWQPLPLPTHGRVLRAIQAYTS